jgi:hypothetical protein
MAIVELKVPYLSQRDNEIAPGGTCNVTSIAMCMAFFGEPVLRETGEQLEDYLTRYCLDNGLSRHSPGDLEVLAQRHGYRPRFSAHSTWKQVKAHLDSGKPCVVHGWFTASGHIITITGYDENGWVVNDPWGEWWSSGYDTSASGKGLTYSYGMMSELCGPDGDGQLWIHFFDGPSEDKRVWKPGELGGLRLQDIYERKLVISLADIKKDIGLVKQIQICLSRFPQFQPGIPDGIWGPVTQRAFENFAFNFQMPSAGSIDATTAEVLIEGKYK